MTLAAQLSCPICGQVWPQSTPQCLRCYFDLANNDASEARDRLERRTRRANAMWLGGSAMVFLAPAVMFGLPLAVGSLLGMSMFSVGVLLVTFGLIQGDSAKKLLIRVKDRTQLPPARLL